MSKWLFITILAFVVGVYLYGYGQGRKAAEAKQVQAGITLTDQSLAKLNTVDRTWDAILSDIRKQKVDVPCPVSNSIRHAIDLMPDGDTGK